MGLFTLAAAAVAQAQSVPSPGTETASAKPSEGAIVLNPFEVSTTSDEGYAARETLAGTRFKSELKDVPAQVSIMTKEFLQDIAAVTPEEAFRYSANVENMSEFTSVGNADINQGVLNQRISGRIRGLASPGTTRDFFQTFMPQDNYNSERISISSGPNAILFGNGNPGGVVDTGFIRPQLARPRYELGVRMDDNGSIRGTVDLNQPILKNRLGARVALLKGTEKHWRKPGEEKNERVFGTISYKPFSNTTIRIYGADETFDRTPVRNVRTFDSVTPWIAAGRPAFNNGLVNPTVIGATNNSYWARNTVANRPVLLWGQTGFDAYRIWGSAATAAPTAAGTIYSVNTIGPGSTPNQTGTNARNYSLPLNEAISPFDISINGNGTRSLFLGKLHGGSIEQRITRDLFLQLDYNRESVKNPVADFLTGSQSVVRADANMFLPWDRATPNPNFGKYYVESNPRTFHFRGEREDMRAMLSYELDFTDKGASWVKWFGRHRMAGMYLRAFGMNLQQENGPRLVPAGTSYETALANFAGAPYNTLTFRTYLSDPQDSRTGNTYHVTVPIDPVRQATWTLPDGSTYYGIGNPFGATGMGTMTSSLNESRLLAVQSFFLKNRLVGSFGWRNDRVRQATYVTQRKGAPPAGQANNYAWESINDIDPPKDWNRYTSGKTTTAGLVAHVLPWFSVFYNQSSTWNPPIERYNPDDGSSIPGSTGDGKDYGVMLRLFGERLSLRLNKYENTNGPTGNEFYRNGIIPAVKAIEDTIIDRFEDGTIAALPPEDHYDPTGDAFQIHSLVSDLKSVGYEFELVANPTRNWRVALNGAKSSSTTSNIGQAWVRYIQQRAPVWDQHRALTGPANTNTTIATRYLGIVEILNQMKQADGQKVESGRDWRINLVTRYAFSEGKLRGAFVGGAYRWRSKQTIGYLASLEDNAFPFQGAPAQVRVPALDSPVFGKPLNETDAFVGYQRRLGRQLSWRVQLNVRNLFNQRDATGNFANTDTGAIGIYNVPDPRLFILTNTFIF